MGRLRFLACALLAVVALSATAAFPPSQAEPASAPADGPHLLPAQISPWPSSRASTFTGKGETIAFLDTGLDALHPAFTGRVVASLQAGPLPSGLWDASAQDATGHGTHVASIAAAAPDGKGKHGGVAPDAKIVSFKVGFQDDSGETRFRASDALQGYEWVLEHHDELGIRVVVNSWGAAGEYEPRSPVNQATKALYEEGVFVVFAAGNDGRDGEHTLNKYCPAPWVLCVGAIAEDGTLPAFSARGTAPHARGLANDHPDLVAPGVRIDGARPSALGGHAYGLRSGTSMAAPFVAALAARLLEANPDLDPDQLMSIMVASAKPLPGYEMWEVGAGQVNAEAAVALALSTPGHRSSFLQGERMYSASSRDANTPLDVLARDFDPGSVPFYALADQVPDWASWLLLGTPIIVACAIRGTRHRTIETGVSQAGPPRPQTL